MNLFPILFVVPLLPRTGNRGETTCLGFKNLQATSLGNAGITNSNTCKMHFDGVLISSMILSEDEFQAL
jgi:hypothetical protein